MWNKITDIARTAASMLQSGKFPPNTPEKYQEDMGKINFLASKKFFVVFCSVLIISAYFGIGTFVLFLTAPFPALTPSFVTMFVEVLKVFVIIIGSFLGLQTVLDYSMSSNTNIDLQGQNINVTERVDRATIEKYEQKYSGDPSYAPLKWVGEYDE